MSVIRSPPWERTRSTSETKILTPQTVPLHIENSNSMPCTNLAQSGSKTNGPIQSAPISCNNNMRSTLLPWSAERYADNEISSPVFPTSCVSTTGMPTTTTTNSSTTTCSAVASNGTTTTASTELMVATLLSASTQSATPKKQAAFKRVRNSPTKVSTSTASSKKIKATSTLSQSKLPNYWLSGTSSANKFAVLDVDDEEESAQTANSGQIKDPPSQNINANKDVKEKNNKPPPIYVQGVECIKTLKSALNEVANNSFTLKILANNEVRIQAENLQIYNQLHHMLKEKGTKLYTFRPKSERGFKVVLRNMHHSTDQEEIKKELSEHGHKVLNITNIIQRTTKNHYHFFSSNYKQVITTKTFTI